MKKSFVFLLAALPALAFAGAMDQLDASLRAAATSTTTDLQATAVLWLSSFIGLQMLVTNLGLLKSGADIEAVFGKLIGSLLWFGVCFYILQNGPQFIDSVGKGFLNFAAKLSGGTGFDAAQILNNGAKTAANLVAKINEHSHLTNLFMPAIIGGLVGLVIIGTAALIAFKVFLIKIELMLTVMLAPLSFSFLGLNALKDQGISPFKSLISLIYRLVLLAVVLKSMSIMSDNLVNVIGLINDDSIDGIWDSLFAATCGFVLLGFLAFKSDSLASNLASGSTSLGTGDVAAAAALGAAAGAVAGSAASSLAGGATKTPKSMADFLKSLVGGGGGGATVSNGGGEGSGGGGGGGAPGGAGDAFGSPVASIDDAPKMPVPPPSPYPLGSKGQPLPLPTSSGGQASQAATNVAATKDFVNKNPGAPKTGQEISDFASTLAPPSAPAGSGGGSSKVANIGGVGSAPQMPASDTPPPSTGSGLGNLAAGVGEMNKHMANEKSGTSVSISTLNPD